MTSWSDGRPTDEMLPADELKVVETKTFEGEAKMVTLAVALETEEVVRTNEVPRRTRKSWGIRLPPAEVGPRVDVTVPLVALVNATTCLEQVDQMDQCTGINKIWSKAYVPRVSSTC